MRTLVIMSAAVVTLTSTACNKNCTKDPGESLLLVEAGLASRLLSGKLEDQAFCEKQIPYLQRRGARIELQCTQRKDLLQIEEEKTDGARTVLRLKGGGKIELQKVGRQRYRVRGNPCDPAPRFYVVFADAKVYRQRWLKSARCPSEDMKLAN